VSDIETYQQARIACELARNLLSSHDFQELLRAIERAESVGPIVDPTLYRAKAAAINEDRDVFAAALKFLRTWPEPKGNG
jgi:hypothetical protein